MPESTTPTRDYRVELDAYSGPLDLLLYLVKRHEIDLNDIPIARLTEQYIEHLRVLEFIDVENAGEFLVMAATLLEIKSQMLIPHVAERLGEDEPEPADGEAADATAPVDPRYELVQQLLSYKRFKEAAIALEHRHEDWSARFAAAPKTASADPDEADNAQERELDLEDVNVLDLCEAFARILDSIGAAPQHEITYDDTPIGLHAEDIYDRLVRDAPDGSLTLGEIFVGRDNRSELIGLFLALLELVRTARVRFTQDGVGGPIHLRPIPVSEQAAGPADQADAEPTDWRDPETGEMRYDWPDEEARARSEKRKRLRASRLARMRAGEDVEDLDAEEEEDKFEGLDEDDPLADL